MNYRSHRLIVGPVLAVLVVPGCSNLLPVCPPAVCADPGHDVVGRLGANTQNRHPGGLGKTAGKVRVPGNKPPGQDPTISDQYPSTTPAGEAVVLPIPFPLAPAATARDPLAGAPPPIPPEKEPANFAEPQEDVTSARKTEIPRGSFPLPSFAKGGGLGGTEPLPTVPVFREPVVLALEHFLSNRPEEALHHLQVYDRSSQEVFLRLLPVLAQLTRKGLMQLDRQEASALYEQLHAMVQALRSRAELVIEQMCYCSSIESFGLYQPLPDNYTFRPWTDNQPGEVVQLYVQLRNLCGERCNDGYQVCLWSTVEICDLQGERLWYYDFRDRERPVRSQAPVSDCFRNYSFTVPRRLRPGEYRLTIQIRDLTRPGAERIARKTLPFRVG